MKNKKLLILLIILAPAAIWFLMQNDEGTLREADSGFAISDTSTVSKIFIADMNSNSVLLERANNGWLLNGKSKTNSKLVDMLLGTMQQIKVKSPVPIAARDNVVKRLSSIGIKVEIYQNAYRINIFGKLKFFPYEKLAKVYYVGDVTPDNLGTYMLMDGAAEPYVTHIPRFRGFLSPRFSPISDDWISHQVFNQNLTDIASVSIEFLKEPEESFKVDVIDSYGNYKLIKLYDERNITRFDTLKLLNFLTSFNDLRYESRLNNIVSPIFMDSVINSPPLFVITLVDDKNDTTKVKGFVKKALSEEVKKEAYFEFIPDDSDRFHALINKGDDFVLMQYYVFDKVLYPLSYFSNK
jgi:hypothetical protein